MELFNFIIGILLVLGFLISLLKDAFQRIMQQSDRQEWPRRSPDRSKFGEKSMKPLLWESETLTQSPTETVFLLIVELHFATEFFFYLIDNFLECQSGNDGIKGCSTCWCHLDLDHWTLYTHHAYYRWVEFNFSSLKI